MSEIDGLSNSLYFSAIQTASLEQARLQKKEKAKESSPLNRFSDLLKTKDDSQEESFSTKNLPPEIQGMTLDEAVVFLKDAVDLAGNDLSQSFSMENLNRFKKTVSQFISFVVNNNFEVTKKEFRRGKSHKELQASVHRLQYFSTYNDRPDPKRPPRIQIEIINKKLDELTKGMLSDQKNNLKILADINEIKGLIVDLLQG